MPTLTSAARTVAHATKPIQEWDGVTKPFGFFDPAGMSKVEGSEALLPWCRMAEIKHGRVAMLASVGFIVQELGVHFPGAISAANYPYPYFIGFPGPKNFADVDFGSLGAHPFDQWASVPAEGKVQIIATLGMIELLSEMQKPHPTNRDNADEIGSVELLWNVPFFLGPKKGSPFWGKKDADGLKRGRNSELNNGRAAMIGVMSFIAASNIPGSVPLLNLS